MERLKLAAIGCGNHASRAIHPSIVRIDEIDFVAACDLDEERLARAADRYNVRTYGDMNEMFANERLDAALVIGPPAMHHEVGLKVLQAGHHVILEKPTATSVEGARELVDAAQAVGKMGAMSTHWRHSVGHVKMKEVMDRPDFGRPIFYEARFHAPGPTKPGFRETALLSYLYAQGVHLVDCTRFLMGDIDSVYTRVTGSDNERFAMAVSLRFANGASGDFAMVAGAPVMEHYVEAYSDSGRRVRVLDQDHLQYFEPSPWMGRGGYADVPSQQYVSQQSAHTAADRIAYVAEHRAFAQALLAGEQPRASLEDGYQALRVLEAINESALTGQVVAVEH